MKRVYTESIILAVLLLLQEGTPYFGASTQAGSTGASNTGMFAFVAAHRTIEEDDETGEIQSDDGAGDAVIEDLSEVEEQGSMDEYQDDDDGAADQDPSKFATPQGQPKTFGSVKDKILGFFQHDPEYYWIHYKLEFAALTIFLVLLYIFIDGKNLNATLAISWCTHAVKMLKKEFEHIGCAQTKNIAVMQRSYSEYDYFASGRKNLLYADFKLYLIRRHCVLTRYLFDLLKGNEDYLELSIPIDIGDRKLPLEFFMCRRKDMKQKMTELTYLKDYVKNATCKHYRIPEADQNKNTLMIMSEHDEIANFLIDAQVGADLAKFAASGILHELHITDLQTYNHFPLFLRAIIAVPSASSDARGFEEHTNLI